MKVLLFSHPLELGGSQVCAIDLAAALRDRHGHDVVILGAPGPAEELVARRGLRHIPAPAASTHPSPAVIRRLRAAVREERPDVVHAWDWPQILDAFYGLGRSVTIVGTDMSMSVHRALPRRIRLTYGTAELVERARSMRRGPVSLLVPPVDTDENAPGAADPAPFARAHGLDGEHLNIVVVSRLVDWMKLEGVRAAVDAVAGLAPSLPVRLAVVGDGDARAGLAARADEVNAGLGVRAVAVTGPLVDPRPAYAWADVVVGMGSSVLRGMAFAKPCIVVGEGGFAEPVTPETVDQFLWRGFFGVGAGAAAAERLGAELRGLAGDPARRAGLGAWSRRLVVDRFGLAAGAAALDAQYREAASSRPGRRDVVVDGGSTAVRLAASRALPGRVKELLRGGEVRR